MGVDHSAGEAAALIGRGEDLARVHGFLDQAAAQGATLLLSGDPGVGKTALLEAAAAAASASGTRVLRVSGAEFEADIAFSCLNQLLFPLQSGFDELEEMHRSALRVALGFGDGPTPNRLVVSNAALVLLCRAAEKAPLLVVVDDLPWLDEPSAAVLGFIARRVGGTRIGILAASRIVGTGPLDQRSFTEHKVTPLTDDASDELVTSAFPALAGQVRRTLLAAARGNPLALLELPSALTGPQRSALERLPRVLPLSQRLQTLFVARINDLSATSQLLLLLAALEGSGDLAVLQFAFRELTGLDSLDDLAAAESEQLVQVDDDARRLDFRHPLIRAAVVQAATSTERRRAHRAIGEALSGSPERQAWHLGEATLEPDEHVAAQLEDAARRILKRGDPAGAVRALVRAADLSPVARHRAGRLAEAAYTGAAAGDLRRATELLASARRADTEQVGSLHAATAVARLVLDGDGDVEGAHRVLLSAIEAGDHRYEASNGPLVEALHTLLLICYYCATPELWEPYEAALARFEGPVPTMLWVSSLTFADPAQTALDALPYVDDMIASVRDEINPTPIVRAGTGLIYLDRLGDLREPQWRVIRQGRDGGPARRPLGAQFHLCLDDFLKGRWEEAAELAEEGVSLCRTSELSFEWYFTYVQSLLAAAAGRHDEAEKLTDGIIRWAVPRGVRCAVAFALHARVLDSVGRGDFERAYRQATEISPAGVLASHAPHALWVGMDLVEAALRTDRHEEAAAHVRAMQEARLGEISPRMALLVGASAALCADDETADGLFAQALAEPGTDRWPLEAARVRLAHGQRLRRRKAHAESRAPLGAALQTFEHLGAHPWAERAAKEYRATGASPGRTRKAAGGGTLTPQEREIAQLAASGLTNKQIGERLFLSHRTVGAHLYQIYPKLGIASRAALRDALGDLDDQGRGGS